MSDNACTLTVNSMFAGGDNLSAEIDENFQQSLIHGLQVDVGGYGADTQPESPCNVFSLKHLCRQAQILNPSAGIAADVALVQLNSGQLMNRLIIIGGLVGVKGGRQSRRRNYRAQIKLNLLGILAACILLIESGHSAGLGHHTEESLSLRLCHRIHTLPSKF